MKRVGCSTRTGRAAASTSPRSHCRRTPRSAFAVQARRGRARAVEHRAAGGSGGGADVPGHGDRGCQRATAAPTGVAQEAHIRGLASSSRPSTDYRPSSITGPAGAPGRCDRPDSGAKTADHSQEKTLRLFDRGLPRECRVPLPACADGRCSRAALQVLSRIHVSCVRAVARPPVWRWE